MFLWIQIGKFNTYHRKWQTSSLYSIFDWMIDWLKLYAESLCRRYIVETLPIRRKTLSNQSINQSTEPLWVCSFFLRSFVFKIFLPCCLKHTRYSRGIRKRKMFKSFILCYDEQNYLCFKNGKLGENVCLVSINKRCTYNTFSSGFFSLYINWLAVDKNMSYHSRF